VILFFLLTVHFPHVAEAETMLWSAAVKILAPSLRLVLKVQTDVLASSFALLDGLQRFSRLVLDRFSLRKQPLQCRSESGTRDPAEGILDLNSLRSRALVG